MFLITGSNGQLGSELKNFYTQNKTALFTNSQELDISNETNLRTFFDKQERQITRIINCAAYTKVDQAEEEKELAQAVNSLGVKNLAKISQEREIPFIQISTDYVFDGAGSSPYQESDLTNPVSVYGESKLLGEKALLEIADSGLIIRTAWLYSAFGKNFVKTILRLSKANAKERKEIRVVFDQIGTPTYAYDLASAIYLITESPKFKELQKNKQKEIYHFSNQGVASWYDFAYEIINSSKEFRSIDLQPVLSQEYKTLAKRPYYSVLDNSKIKKDFNLKIRYWKEALKECLIKLNQS